MESDPLRDIEAMTRVRLVMKDGHILDGLTGRNRA